MPAVIRALAALLLIAAVPSAQAHDHWISQGGYKGKGQAAGEWCCGEGDCFVIPSEQVRYIWQRQLSGGPGYIWRYDTTKDGAPASAEEFIPESEVQASPDGQYWRCRRPDGTRRCFFAPPPGS